MQKINRYLSLNIVMTLMASALLAPGKAAHADMIAKQQAIALCKLPVQVGPKTPYGEADAEVAAKRIAFEWNCTAMVSGDAKTAFEKYVSKDFCDHSHLMTQGQKDCGNYEETLTNFARMAKQFGGGDTLEVPVMAAVNGEMVTMYGEGVDIFRVKDGKLTDHWDASPPAEITIKAHASGFAEWVWGERKGPPPMLPSSGPTGVLIDQMRLTAVDTGPLTPYAETAKEAANKRVLFAWSFMSSIQGKSKEAAEKYVSADFCDHSHMLTRGKKLCGTREDMLASPVGMHQPAKLGDRIEIPYMATVNGEMVTMYGAGIDIFRVQNGKITDHWDASPPKAVTIKAHAPEVVERMIRTLAGEVQFGPPGPAPGP